MTTSEPLAVSVSEAVRLTGVGRSSLYEAIRRGDLPIRKAGKRTLVMMEDIRRWLSSLPASTGGTKAA
jgi:excisionase family DNA binding protein